MTQALETRTSFLKVRGLRVRYSVRGEGHPLLLLNGIGANMELFEPLRRELGGVQSIAFDVPGTGGSATPWVPRRFFQLARIAAELLDELGHRKTDVLGVSWGGAFAQAFAGCYPHRVRKLILAATTCGWTMVPGRPSALRVLATPKRYFSPNYMNEIAPVLYGGEIRRNPQIFFQQEHSRLLRPPSFRGYLWQLYAIWGWSSLPYLWWLKHPTLVLAGDDDPIVPVINARVLAQMLPNSHLHVVRGGGHLFLLMQAPEMAKVIGNFLEGEWE